jgi:hypothetical protein
MSVHSPGSRGASARARSKAAAEHPGGVSRMSGAGLAGRLGRALGLSLEQQGVSQKVAGLALGDSERPGPGELGLGRGTVAEHQIGSGLGEPERLVLRLRLDRV